MTSELNKFKRYCNLLKVVYNSNGSATNNEKEELNTLGYELELNGVPHVISEMNFNRLQRELEDMKKRK